MQCKVESLNEEGRTAEKQIPVGEKKVIQGKNGKETKADDNENFKEGRTAMKQTLMLRDVGEERRAESQNEKGRTAEKQKPMLMNILRREERH